MNKCLTISFLAICGLTPSIAFPDEDSSPTGEMSTTIAEARELILATQLREDKILKNIRLKWVHQFGICKDPDQVLDEGFDQSSPVSTTLCSWLSNDGTFMSKAQGEPSSVDPVDKDDQVVLAQTNFSTYFLETPDSRLYVAMHKHRSKPDFWRGLVQCREFGFDDRAGVSPAVPVGATGSRSRDLSILLSLLNLKTATVSFTNGVSDCGIPSKVLQIKRAPPIDYSVSVYFDTEHSMVVQHKQSRGGVLQSNSVVVETMTVADGDQEFVIPKVIVTSSRTPIPGPIEIQFPGPIKLQRRDQWTLHRSIVTLAKLESVPLEEMVIDLQGAEPRFSRQGMLDGKRKRYPSNQLTGVERITAQNLDELVSGLFANEKQKTE